MFFIVISIQIRKGFQHIGNVKIFSVNLNTNAPRTHSTHTHSAMIKYTYMLYSECANLSRAHASAETISRAPRKTNVYIPLWKTRRRLVVHNFLPGDYGQWRTNSFLAMNTHTNANARRSTLAKKRVKRYCVDPVKSGCVWVCVCAWDSSLAHIFVANFGFAAGCAKFEYTYSYGFEKGIMSTNNHKCMLDTLIVCANTSQKRMEIMLSARSMWRIFFIKW